MHREVIDVEPRLFEAGNVCENGRGEKHDEIPVRHEHHLSLHAEVLVILVLNEVFVVICISLVNVFEATILSKEGM